MDALKIYSVEDGKEVLLGEITKEFAIKTIKEMIATDSKEPSFSIKRMLERGLIQKIEKNEEE